MVGASLGNGPHRSVRNTSVCGTIPCSLSQLKYGRKSVPPPPRVKARLVDRPDRSEFSGQRHRSKSRARVVAAVLQGSTESPLENEARGNTISAREILDKASRQIDSGLNRDPRTSGADHASHGRCLRRSGPVSNRGIPVNARCWNSPQASGTHAREILESKCLLGWVLQEEGHFPEAEKLQRETLNDDRRTLDLTTLKLCRC